MDENVKHAMFVVDEDDMKYLACTGEEMAEILEKDPTYLQRIRDGSERWIQARDLNNDLVWLNLLRVKRLEFKEISIKRI